MRMEELRDVRHLLATVLMAGFGVSMVIPAIADVTVESMCPGQDLCTIAIYLSGFQQAMVGLGAMVLTPLIGNLSDKYGRKSLLTLPVALPIIPSAILAYKRSIGFFYAYYVMKTLTAMLSDGALISLALAYAADKVPAGRRISAFGIVSGAFPASFLCGNFVARFLPIGATFQVAMWSSLLALVYMRIFLEESIPDDQNDQLLSRPISKTETEQGDGDDGDNVPELPRIAPAFKTVPSVKQIISLLRRSSTFSRTAIVCFFNSLALGWQQASLLYYLKARFHSNKDQFASLLILMGGLGTISQSIVASSLSAVIGDKKLLSASLFATLLQLFFLSISWSFWVVYASFTLLLLSFCVIPATCSIASNQVEPREQGKAQGCIFGIQSFANAISPLAFNPLVALFLSEDAPFHFPGFSILCIELTTLVAFVLSLTIQV